MAASDKNTPAWAMDIKNDLTSIKMQLEPFGGFLESHMELKSNVSDLDDKFSLLEKKFIALEKRIDLRDSDFNKHSIIFVGFKESPYEDLHSKVEDFLVDIIKIKTDQFSCFRMGAFRPSAASPRSIRVDFYRVDVRNKVWGNRRNCKGSLFIMRECFTPSVEENRRKLQPFLINARQANKKASLQGERLRIDDRTFTVDDIATMNQDLTPVGLPGSNTTGDKTIFFGKACPLSNFHPAHFKIHGQAFSSAEQCYQAKKANAAKNKPIYEKIMATEDPREIKMLSHKIKETQWDKVSAMKEAIRAKFQQNDQLKAILIETKDQILAEGNLRDKFWGIGKSIFDKSAFNNQDDWGHNWTGKILMEVRDTLKGTQPKEMLKEMLWDG